MLLMHMSIPGAVRVISSNHRQQLQQGKEKSKRASKQKCLLVPLQDKPSAKPEKVYKRSCL